MQRTKVRKIIRLIGKEGKGLLTSFEHLFFKHPYLYSMKKGFQCIVFFLLLAGLPSCERDLADLEKGEMFRLNIDHEESISYDFKVAATFTEWFKHWEKEMEGDIEKRGGFSSGFYKHSYELGLERDYPLAGLPKDDDWILNSSFIDKTFLRHALSFDLFREMGPHNLSPRYQYLELYRGQKYEGLYILMQKLDRSTLDVHKNDDEAVIFKEPHLFRLSYENQVPEDPNNFHHQIYPDLEVANKNEEMEGLRSFILTADNQVFRDKFGEYFYLENILDWHLLLLLSNNSDGILKNFYLFRQRKGQAYQVAIWDYDHSFGRDGDNELNLEDVLPDVTRSILFSRLMQESWYKEALKDRWQYHKDSGLFTGEKLKDRISDQAVLIRPFAEQNFEKWPLDSFGYFDDNDFDQEIEIMLQFINQRIPLLEKYFEEL